MYAAAMAIAAKIKFTQGVLDPAAGLALIGDVSVPVTCANDNNSLIDKFEWSILSVPLASAIVPAIVSVGQTPTMQFTPDVTGTYVIVLRVYDRFGNLAEDMRCFSVLEPSGRLIPSFGAAKDSANFSGQPYGWDPYMQAWLKYVDTLSVAPTFDFASYGSGSADNWWVGGLTAGWRFRIHKAGIVLKGVKIWVKRNGGPAGTAATINLKVSLWKGDGTSVVTQTFSSVPAGEGNLNTLLFSSPPTLATLVDVSGSNGHYILGVYDTSGTSYPYLPNAAYANQVIAGNSPAQWPVLPGITFQGLYYVGGDAMPTTGPTSEFYPITPLFTLPP